MRVAILGAGQRGVLALNRIAAHARGHARQVSVILVEPGPIGPGVHWLDQPAYLWLNTVAGQATAFCDSRMADGAPALDGPGFLEWARDRGVQHVVRHPEAPDHVEASDFLPRHIWGEYLVWAARETLRAVPPNVTVDVHHGIAVDLVPQSGRALVTLDNGRQHEVDLALVTTGHGLRSASSPAPDGPWDAFPLPDTVAIAPPGAIVGIAGMGLTAIDVVAALTVGRRGRFDRSGERVRYLRSGEEPQVVMWSTTGWFPCARPCDPRDTPSAQSSALTFEAVEARRRSRLDGRLSFVDDVMPLIVEAVLSRLVTDDEQAAARNILGIGKQRWSDGREYRDDVLRQIAWDLDQARSGLNRSRFKEQMEILRDCREVLRAVVRPPGLTLEGHRDFFRVLPAMANRAAVGPQIERVEEVLALVEAGIVRLGPGARPAVTRDQMGWTLHSTQLDEPSAMHIDHLVQAHLDWPRPIGGQDPLRGAIERWAARHPADERYLDLTVDGCLRSADGGGQPPIAVFGPPAEGANFYNNYVLWPGVPSRVVADMDSVIGPLFGPQDPNRPRL